MTVLITSDIMKNSGVQPADFSLVSEKAGVYVYKCLYKGKPAVSKYFANAHDRREIVCCRVLNVCNVPTAAVYAYGDVSYVMEDISASSDFRLSTEEDLHSTAAALALARWYFTLHENCINAMRDDMYFEYDALTPENFRMLREKMTESTGLFDFLLDRSETLRYLLYTPEFVMTYNDFYYTNFAMRRDGSAAFMFDYNLTGRGWRYSDMRNIQSSLSAEAYSAFSDEYGRLYREKHGLDYRGDPLEIKLDGLAAPLFSLITGYKRSAFPDWAQYAKKEAENGLLLQKAAAIFG